MSKLPCLQLFSYEESFIQNFADMFMNYLHTTVLTCLSGVIHQFFSKDHKLNISFRQLLFYILLESYLNKSCIMFKNLLILTLFSGLQIKWCQCYCQSTSLCICHVVINQLQGGEKYTTGMAFSGTLLIPYFVRSCLQVPRFKWGHLTGQLFHWLSLLPFGTKEMVVGQLLSRCAFYCHKKDHPWLSQQRVCNGQYICI